MLPLILASSSSARHSMLHNAGLHVESHPPRIDEDAIRTSLMGENAKPRDIADTLAEFKARKVAQQYPTALVLGSYQILSLDGKIFNKPSNRDEAAQQLARLSGKTHELFSAAVIYEQDKPVWRHVGRAKMTMHNLSAAEIDAYLTQAWPSVKSSVGAYHAESIGAQLFTQIEGDWFTVLGLPLLEVLSYLRLRGKFAP